MNIQTNLTPDEAEALRLLLSRMSFDDFLKLTDGDSDSDQAYFFSGAAAKLKDALAEGIDREETEYGLGKTIAQRVLTLEKQMAAVGKEATTAPAGYGDTEAALIMAGADNSDVFFDIHSAMQGGAVAKSFYRISRNKKEGYSWTPCGPYTEAAADCDYATYTARRGFKEKSAAIAAAEQHIRNFDHAAAALMAVADSTGGLAERLALADG